MSSTSSVNNAAAGQPSILTDMTSGIELEVIAYAPPGVDPQRHLANALRQPFLLPCSKCNQTHCSRIPILRYRGHPDPGVQQRPNAVYKYDQKAKQSYFAGSGSRLFLENLRLQVDVSCGKSRTENRRAVTLALQDANVPTWLDRLLEFNKVKDFLDDYANCSAGQQLPSRYLAVNLDNLRSSNGKNTVEVRLSPGSMDPSEVYAWYDLMGKLMLWLSTPEIAHNFIILDIWADPKSTVLDLIKQIGASQFTLDYYTDRLTPDWAIRRHSRLTSNIDTSDPFKAFKLAIENNRLKDALREAVDAKISQKLEGGYYGQLPDTVFKTLPAEIQNHPDSHTLNMDVCDYEQWTDKAIAIAKTIDFYAPLSPSDSDSECDCKWCQLESCGCKKCLKELRRLCCDCGCDCGCDCKCCSKKSRKYSLASHLSDSSEEFPFRKTDHSKRTFATSALRNGFLDTRPDTPTSPSSFSDDIDLSYYGL